MIPTAEALRLAHEAGLDLVEVSPNERPPVCKIMDYGKQKYLQSKKLKQKHHEQKLKELRLRPKTDRHDREIRIRQARKFLEQGDRVKFTMIFRGREKFHKDMGEEGFNEIAELLRDLAKVEQPARLTGRFMSMVLVPLKVTPPQKKAKPESKPTERIKSSSPSGPEGPERPAEVSLTAGSTEPSLG